MMFNFHVWFYLLIPESSKYISWTWFTNQMVRSCNASLWKHYPRGLCRKKNCFKIGYLGEKNYQQISYLKVYGYTRFSCQTPSWKQLKMSLCTELIWLKENMVLFWMKLIPPTHPSCRQWRCLLIICPMKTKGNYFSF